MLSLCRLGKDQQLARFASRGKLVLSSWDPSNLAKIPLEKAPGAACFLAEDCTMAVM